MKVLHRRDASFKVLHWPKLFDGLVCPQGRPAKNGRSYGYSNGNGSGRGYGYRNGRGYSYGYYDVYGYGNGYGSGYGNGYGGSK